MTGESVGSWSEEQLLTGNCCCLCQETDRISNKTARDKKAFHDDSRLNQQELLTKAQTSYFQTVLQNGLDLRRAQASY